MKFIYFFLLLFAAYEAPGQSYGERINKLQHAISISIVGHNTTELRSYFTDETSFTEAAKFLSSIAAQKKKLGMSAEQIGVYKKPGDGIDSLTIVYMGGDDAAHAPAMLGQMIFTTKPDTKDWIYTSVKAIVPANKVKNPLSYLQVYINMQGMPPPPMEKIK